MCLSSYKKWVQYIIQKLCLASAYFVKRIKTNKEPVKKTTKIKCKARLHYLNQGFFYNDFASMDQSTLVNCLQPAGQQVGRRCSHFPLEGNREQKSFSLQPEEPPRMDHQQWQKRMGLQCSCCQLAWLILDLELRNCLDLFCSEDHILGCVHNRHLKFPIAEEEVAWVFFTPQPLRTVVMGQGVMALRW